MTEFRFTHANDEAAFEGSTFASAAYYNEDSLQLVIVSAKDSSILFYDDVEPEVGKEFLRAESPGQYYFRNIRGRYEYTPDADIRFFEEQTPVIARAEDVTVSEIANPDANGVPNIYKVEAYFNSREDAWTFFTYAEGSGTQVTITAHEDF